MADTFTAKKGYLASVTWSAEPVNIRGEVRVTVARGLLEITCIGDTIAPFRSYTFGLYDQMSFSVPVPFDETNDAVAAIMVDAIAGTADTLIILDAVAGNTLLSGQALVTYEWSAPVDELQMLNVTFTFTGALTGNLVV